MSIARRSLQVAALLCTLIVGVASMAVIVTQTAWFKDWLRGFIVRQSEDYVNGRLSIGRMDGNLFFGVQFEDIEVSLNGEPVIGVSRLGVDYSIVTLLSGDIIIDEVRLHEPVVRLARTEDGWNLAELVKPQPDDPARTGAGPVARIVEIAVVDGTLHLDDAVGTSGVDVPSRVENLNASLSVTSSPEDLSVDVAHVSLEAVDPSFGVDALSGVIRRSDDTIAFENVTLRTEESSLRVDGTIEGLEGDRPVVNLSATSDRLTIAEIARLVPALRGYDLAPSFEITATGPTDAIAVQAGVREDRVGTIDADVTVDAAAPGQRVAGTVSVTGLNVAPLMPPPDDASASRDPIQSDITGRVTFDLAFPDEQRPLSGTYALSAPRVRAAGYEVRSLQADGRVDGETVRLNLAALAYGSRVTAAGTVRTGEPLVVDMRGRVTEVDLRNLPASLDVPAVESDLNLTYRVSGRDDVFSGTIIFDPSRLAGATIAEGTTANGRMGDGAPQYDAEGQIGDLDLQRIGEAFAIDALASDRYRSRINASFDIRGAGGGEYPLDVRATGTIVDTELFGARFPKIEFAAETAGGDAQVTTIGQFAGLNPATVAENPNLAGTVNGTIDATTTLRDYADGVTIDSIDFAGRLTLSDSNVADLAITSALVDGRYSNREGELQAFDITGPDISASGQGYLSLTESGTSDLTVHLASASLDRIGELVDQPITGAATVDATVTGNARELKLDGTLTGSDLGYGDNEALSVASDFSVVIPDLTPARARVQSETMATFVEVGGQQITELAADVTYAESMIEFMATAQEGVRELDAGGSVTLHPDHQEVHLLHLALRTEGLEWRMPPGSEAAVQYAKDRIAVQNIELVSNGQRILADGVVGSTVEPLHVRLENVDIGEVDRLLLGEQQVAGRLSAMATVTGPTDALNVDAEFSLTEGAFRDYTFDALTGAVQYDSEGVSLDVRLDQSETEWLTAQGRAPMTLFQPNPEGVEGHRDPSPGDTIDIQISSSEIGLGLIQGFTTVVTDVTGDVQANLQVTGSGYDPHLSGTVDVRGGAFRVPEYGTAYTGLDTRIDLTPEGLRIQEFRILDDRGFPMTVGGTLGFHARSVGNVDVRIVSDRFEVIDNALADIKLNADVMVTGEVRSPRIVGTVDVENGTIHLAELLARVTADPYATEAASEAAAAADAEAAEPSVFDAMALDLTISVPNNLVLRGNDIRAAGAPVPIGDMNITVGGDIEIDKNVSEPFRLSGQVNTVRGTYTFQGRRFDIMRDGTIGFSGGDEIDPRLDIRARREISGIDAFVNVRGTMRMPEFSFSSNPPQNEGDILALIVFNQPLNQLGEGQQVSLAQRAGALATGYFTSGLSRSIGNALDLDEFEIQAQGDGGGGPSVTLGEQVGRSLFVRLRQAFGGAQTTELILEYQIADFLRAQGSVAEGSTAQPRVQFRRVERAGLDLIFFFSY